MVYKVMLHECCILLIMPGNVWSKSAWLSMCQCTCQDLTAKFNGQVYKTSVIKGIFRPKMKILSSFDGLDYWPSSFFPLNNLLLLDSYTCGIINGWLWIIQKPIHDMRGEGNKLVQHCHDLFKTREQIN